MEKKDEKPKYGDPNRVRKHVAAKPIDFKSPEGKAAFEQAVKNVMARHADVIKALAKR